LIFTSNSNAGWPLTVVLAAADPYHLFALALVEEAAGPLCTTMMLRMDP
jgi:hypothetical protein